MPVDIKSSSLKRMSPTQQEKLVGLVNKTIGYVNSHSLIPTDALVKAASEGEYSHEFITRAAEAFNGAAHLSHFKVASESDRGSSFQLADPEEAISKMLKSSQSKIASSLTKLNNNLFYNESTSYVIPPTTEDVYGGSNVKTASVNNPIGKDFSAILKAARKLDYEEQKTVKKAEDIYQRACEDLAYKIGAFKNQTKEAEVSQRRKWASETVNWFGPESAEITGLSCGVDPYSLLDSFKKSASEKAYFRNDIPQCRTLADIIKAGDQVSFLHNKLADAQYDHVMNKFERDEAIDNYVREKESVEWKMGPDSMRFTPAYNPARLLTDLNSGLDKALGAFGRSPIGPQQGKEIEQNMADQLLDPSFVQTNKAIDQATILADLLANDEVIASYQPNEIEDSLADITTLAPDAVRYKPLLRAMLRRRLAAGHNLSEYDTQGIMDADKNVAKREIITPQNVTSVAIPGATKDDKKQ